jgi:hypothetical protein
MVISTPQSDDAAPEVVCVDHTDDMEVDRHFDGTAGLTTLPFRMTEYLTISFVSRRSLGGEKVGVPFEEDLGE